MIVLFVHIYVSRSSFAFFTFSLRAAISMSNRCRLPSFSCNSCSSKIIPSSNDLTNDRKLAKGHYLPYYILPFPCSGRRSCCWFRGRWCWCLCLRLRLWLWLWFCRSRMRARNWLRAKSLLTIYNAFTILSCRKHHNSFKTKHCQMTSTI